MLLFTTVETPLGFAGFAVQNNRLLRCVLPRKNSSDVKKVFTTRWSNAQFKKSLEPEFSCSLKRFFSGQPVEKFPLAPDFSGLSDFTGKVYRCLMSVRWGRTVTYSQLAEMAGRPKAARAVGNAMAKNPFPPVVPCHRVLAVSGPGGFGGGLSLKRKMLALEGVTI